MNVESADDGLRMDATTVRGLVVPAYMAAIIPVPFGFRKDKRTDEQKAADTARYVAWEAQRKDDRRALWKLLQAGTGDPLWAVVDLHRPMKGGWDDDSTVGDPADARCEGCEAEGYDADYPEWPCATTVLIARELGIDYGTAAQDYPQRDGGAS